jgi:hypothetical protein
MIAQAMAVLEQQQIVGKLVWLNARRTGERMPHRQSRNERVLEQNCGFDRPALVG